MKTAKQIIGLINTTLKGNRLIFGETSEAKSHKIITSLLYGEDINLVKEVSEYCRREYNY